MKMRFFSSILFATLLGSSGAELALDVPVVEIKPRPEDDVVTTTFSFHNKGTKPVTVTHLDSACSCLSAQLDKAVYQPGEKGVGTAEFKVSSFVGRHEKTLHVTTDDPAQPEWVVPFVLEVPAVVDIEPRNLQWWVGESNEPKTYTVKMAGDEPMHITKISSTREKVEFSSKEISPGRIYEITLRPTTTSEVMLGALKIETDSKIRKYQNQMAFFSVYRRPAEPSKTAEP